MGWRLEDGRKKFYGTARMQDATHSFWWHYLRQLDDPRARAGMVMDDQLSKLGWVPTRSNCGELEEAIEILLASMQKPYRAVLEGIFVARAMSGDVNAEARHSAGSAYVVLPVQYTFAAEAYLAAWHRLLAAEASGEVTGDAIGAVMDDLERHRLQWASSAVIQPAPPEARKGPFEDTQYIETLSAVDRWIMAHEWSHHLLGHEAKGVKKLRLTARVEQFIDAVGGGVVLRGRPYSQLKEFHADILGTALLAGELDESPASPARVFQAVLGGVIALIVEAHVNNTWIVEADSSHPPTLQRLRLLLRWVNERYGALTLESRRLDGMCRSLVRFASISAQTAVYREGDDVGPRPSWAFAIEDAHDLTPRLRFWAN